MEDRNILKKLTIVTAFYTLNIKNNLFNATTYEEVLNHYYDRGKYVSSLDINMVIFCEPNNVGLFTNQRSRNKLKDKTLVIGRSFETLYFHKSINWIKNCFKTNDKLHGYQANKDSPEYIILTLNKLEFLKEIIEKNPFSSEYFVWLDYGISHVANIPEKPYDIYWSLNSLKIDKIKLLLMMMVNDKEVENFNSYFNCLFRGRVAGGFIGGGGEVIMKLYHKFVKLIYKLFSEEIPCLEESVLSYILKYNWDIFDVYYGDYCNILQNISGIIKWNHIIEYNINECKNNFYDVQFRDILNKIFNSANKHNLILDIPSEKLSMYYDCYYSFSWHLNSRDKTLKIVREIIDLGKKYETIRKSFSNYSSLKNNISLIGNKKYIEDFNEMLKS